MVDFANPENNKPIPPGGQATPMGQGPAVGTTTNQPQPPLPPVATTTQQQSNVPVYQPPQEVVVPTVSATREEKGTPIWFYVIFGIVLVVFIAVTTFLVLTLRQKNIQESSVVPATVPAVSQSVLKEPTPILSPTEVKKPESLSDEVEDIEADLKNTDLSLLDQSLNTLDGQIGGSSQ